MPRSSTPCARWPDPGGPPPGSVRCSRRGRPSTCSTAQAASRHLDLAARWLRVARQGLLHDRLVRPRGERGGRGGAAAHRPGAAALPLRCLLRSRAPQQVPGTTPRARRPARPGRRRRRADLAAGGTRCSAGSELAVMPADLDDRLAPAPRARHRRSRSSAPPARRADARGPPTPSWCAASATRRRTTRPRPARSTPRCTSRSQGIPMPLLLVCEDNGLGISVPDAPRLDRARPTATARPRVLRGRRRRPAAVLAAGLGRSPPGCAGSGGRRSCTCAPCGCSATPAPTSRSPTGRRPRSRPTSRATRCWPRRGCSSRAAHLGADEVLARYEQVARAGRRPWPREVGRRPRLVDGRGGDGAARPAPPGRGVAAVARRAATERDAARSSTAACPRTPVR